MCTAFELRDLFQELKAPETCSYLRSDPKRDVLTPRSFSAGFPEAWEE